MPTGISRCYYPDMQPNPAHRLVPEKTYFLVRIHEARAFFPAIWPKQAECLTVSSLVESSFLPDHPVQSLYKFTTLKRNTQHGLGIRTNLTDWLPARTTDTLRITLNYKVLQGKPVEMLVNKVKDLHIETIVSATRPDLAAAIKVSEIVGHLLSSFLHEGEQTEIFSLPIDLNVADLKAGYYIVLGSLDDEPFPNTLELKNGNVTTSGGHALTHYSYVVFQVQAIPSRGQEIIRSEVWGELLQECKDEILRTPIRDEDDHNEAFEKWRNNLELVKRLARKDRSFLESDIRGALAQAVKEVEEQLASGRRLEASGLGDYSDEWKQLLGIDTHQDLRHIVRDYQDAVELTNRLLQQYRQL